MSLIVRLRFLKVAGSRVNLVSSTFSRNASLGLLIGPILLAVASLACAGSQGETNPTGTAVDLSAQDPALAKQLVERFRPVLKLREQTKDCGPGEAYDPGPISLVLGRDNVNLRNLSHEVIAERPRASDVFSADEDTYVEWPGNHRDPGCDFESAYNRLRGDDPPLIYAHIATEEGYSGFVIQYWLFYYYNDFANKHEGDWERIQLRFEADSFEEALREGPSGAAYSGHGGGEKAAWVASKLQKHQSSDNPIVYVAEGSHANYFEPAEFVGIAARGAVAGCETSRGPHRTVEPVVVMLPQSVSDSESEFAWLAYKGKWGQHDDSAVFSGIRGPMQSLTWQQPFTWEARLRDSSEQLPARVGSGVDPFYSICLGASGFSWFSIQYDRRPELVLGSLIITGLLLVFGFSWNLVKSAVSAPVANSDTGLGSKVSMKLDAAANREGLNSPILPDRKRGLGAMGRATYRLYQFNFWLFVPLGILVLGLGLLFSLIASVLVQSDAAFDNRLFEPLVLVLLGFVQMCVSLLLVEAVVATILKQFFDRKDAWVFDSLKSSLRLLPTAVISRLYAFGFVLAIGLSPVLLPIVVHWSDMAEIVVAMLVGLVALPIAINRLVSWFLLEEMVFIETSKSGEARDKSKELIEGHWLRVLGYLTLSSAVLIVPGTVIGFGMLALLPSPVSELVYVTNSLLYGVLLAPIVIILKVMLYYDLKYWPEEDRGRLPDSLREIFSAPSRTISVARRSLPGLRKVSP